MAEASTAPKDGLMAELRAVIANAEDLLERAADEVGTNSVGLRERLRQRMSDAKDSLYTLQSAATDKARAAGRATDDYVHENPWQSVAIGAGIGLLLGMLIARR